MFEGANEWQSIMGKMKDWDKVQKEEQKVRNGKPLGASDGRLRAMALHYWESLQKQPLPDADGIATVDDHHANLMGRLILTQEELDRFTYLLNEVMQVPCG